MPGAGDEGRDAVAEQSLAAYFPPAPYVPVHDADGNLTEDGKWAYTWDAENRLVEMETTAAAVTAGAPKQKLEFAYDSQSRRFSKTVSSWNDASGNWTTESQTTYLYDGWNLIYELSDLQDGSQAEKAYVWGKDLSGSLQGAGGVGGLLMITHAQSSTYFPAFDGNGNVMGYHAADTGENLAEFEYGPFGEPLRATGSKVDQFNFRFSTKYLDTETNLYYYGYRYYDAETGRWLSRDTIEENGGLNLYGFVLNSPLNFWDYLGREPASVSAGGVIYWGSETPDDFGSTVRFETQKERDFREQRRRNEDANTRRLRKEFADQARDFNTNVGGEPCLERDELLLRKSFLQEEFGLSNDEYLAAVAAYAGNEAAAQVAIYASGGALGVLAKTIKRTKFPFLKDHVRRHGAGLSPDVYKALAVRHTQTGTKFVVRHDRKTKHVFVTRTGSDSFTFTSTNRSQNVIHTHLEVNTRYLRNKGITLPDGF